MALLAHWWQRRFDVVNRGFSGYNTRWLLPLVDRLFVPGGGGGAPVKLVTVFLGANDCVLPGNAQHGACACACLTRNSVMNGPHMATRLNSQRVKLTGSDHLRIFTAVLWSGDDNLWLCVGALDPRLLHMYSVVP